MIRRPSLLNAIHWPRYFASSAAGNADRFSRSCRILMSVTPKTGSGSRLGAHRKARPKRARCPNSLIAPHYTTLCERTVLQGECGTLGRKRFVEQGYVNRSQRPTRASDPSIFI